MPAPCLFPGLRYRDPEAALDWLTRVAGFREHAVHRRDGTIAHAELALGASILMIGGSRPDDPNDAMLCAAPPPYVAVDDPDALFTRMQAAGATIEQQPYDTDYGSRDFSVRDPEGKVWNFGSYWPAVAA